MVVKVRRWRETADLSAALAVQMAPEDPRLLIPNMGGGGCWSWGGDGGEGFGGAFTVSTGINTHRYTSAFHIPPSYLHLPRAFFLICIHQSIHHHTSPGCSAPTPPHPPPPTNTHKHTHTVQCLEPVDMSANIPVYEACDGMRHHCIYTAACACMRVSLLLHHSSGCVPSHREGGADEGADECW